MIDPMTKLLAAVGVTGVLMIIGATQPSATASVPAGDTPQSPAEYEVVTGEITEVDPQGQSFNLILGQGEDPTAMTITDQTRFLYNGEQSDMQTVLQVGTQVAVRHIDGTALAVSHRTPQSPE